MTKRACHGIPRQDEGAIDMAKIVELRRFPLKGARGVKAKILGLNPNIGVMGDRRFAIKKRPDTPNEWRPKGVFYVGMNTPLMVAEVPRWDTNDGRLNSEQKLHSLYLERLATKLNVSELSVLDTEAKYNLTDTKGAFVSFLNLASVRELEKFMGKPVNPERFRMNVWFDGLEPFEELSWVDAYPGTREIVVGSANRFRVDDACERCMAPHANPETGVRDLDITVALNALMKQRGYPGSPHRNVLAVMGILACPLEHGAIGINQPIALAT